MARLAGLFVLFVSASASGLEDVEAVFANAAEHWSPQDALEAIDTVRNCRKLPGLFKEGVRMIPQCIGGTPKEIFASQLARAFLVGKQLANITQPDLKKIVDTVTPYVSSFAMAELHKTNVNFCGKAECQQVQRQSITSQMHCEGGYICGTLMATQSRPSFRTFASCKEQTQKLMLKARSWSNLQCLRENEKTYCAEVMEEMMQQDVGCIGDLTGAPSSPECCNLWAKLKGKYPVCTKQIDTAGEQTQRAVADFVHSLDPRMPRMPVKTLTERCQASSADLVV